MQIFCIVLTFIIFVISVIYPTLAFKYATYLMTNLDMSKNTRNLHPLEYRQRYYEKLAHIMCIMPFVLFISSLATVVFNGINNEDYYLCLLIIIAVFLVIFIVLIEVVFNLHIKKLQLGRVGRIYKAQIVAAISYAAIFGFTIYTVILLVV